MVISSGFRSLGRFDGFQFAFRQYLYLVLAKLWNVLAPMMRCGLVDAELCGQLVPGPKVGDSVLCLHREIV